MVYVLFSDPELGRGFIGVYYKHHRLDYHNDDFR